jgi:hypothetical protein
VTFAGHVIDGGCSSFTVTVNVHVVVLGVGLFVSLDVHVTVVVPFANVDPLAGSHTTGRAPLQLSVADNPV